MRRLEKISCFLSGLFIGFVVVPLVKLWQDPESEAEESGRGLDLISVRDLNNLRAELKVARFILQYPELNLDKFGLRSFSQLLSALVKAQNAVAMLGNRTVRHNGCKPKTIRLEQDGSLLVNGDTLVDAKVLLAEVSIVAGISSLVSDKSLVRNTIQWLYACQELEPELFTKGFPPHPVSMADAEAALESLSKKIATRLGISEVEARQRLQNALDKGMEDFLKGN